MEGTSFSIEKSRIFIRVPSLLTVYRRIVQGILFLLGRTLGLTNYVPGSSRGTLFKSPSIFVVVESRRYPKSYAERRNSRIYFSYVLCAVNVQSFFWPDFWWKKKWWIYSEIIISETNRRTSSKSFSMLPDRRMLPEAVY